MSTEIDLDHHDRDFLANRHARYAELRQECPVVHNRHHGGYWLVTGYDAVAAVARDNETFAHKYELGAPDGLDYHGICGVPRPPGIPRQGIAEIDGREHADLRRVLNSLFAPKRAERHMERMRDVSAWFLDQIVEAGEADLVLDYTTPVPAVITLEMMGMPTGNWKHYADFFHAGSTHARDSPEFLAVAGNWQDMMDELLDFAEHRRQNPADDITTALVNCELDGRPIEHDHVGRIMWNLVAGGLDTTTSLVSWGLHHFGTVTSDRDRAIADPSLLPTAVEEFLRYYSPSESLSRTVTRDVELGGQQLRRGDVVLISWVSANRDESVFPDGESVVIDRAPNSHLAFGLGGHRCVGSHLARMESELMLGDVLSRIPDYVIDPAGFRPYPANILMTGVGTMPVTFTPGERRGPTEQPF